MDTLLLELLKILAAAAAGGGLLYGGQTYKKKKNGGSTPPIPHKCAWNPQVPEKVQAFHEKMESHLEETARHQGRVEDFFKSVVADLKQIRVTTGVIYKNTRKPDQPDNPKDLML